MRNSILLHSGNVPPIPDLLTDRLKAAMDETGLATQAIAAWVEKKAAEAGSGV